MEENRYCYRYLHPSVPLDEIPHLAFDYDVILRDAVTRLRERIHFHPIGYELLPEKFTLKHLQSLANLYTFNLNKYNELKRRGFRLEF